MEVQTAEETRAIHITRSGRDAMAAMAQEPRFKGKAAGRLLEALVQMWDNGDNDESD